MYHNEATRLSSLERILAVALVMFSMFALGYTASRVFLTQQSTGNSATTTNVIPHQASMWSDLGK